MTGAYFRVKRNGKFENIELEHLTEIERREILSGRDDQYLLSCIDILSKKVQESEVILDELVEDGVLSREGEEKRV